MIKVMPEADLAEIQNFARKLLQRRDAGCPFPLKNREDIYKDLEVSRQQIQNGEYQDAGKFIAEVRRVWNMMSFCLYGHRHISGSISI